MAESGAKPQIHPLRRRVLDAMGAFFTPLLPDDYIEMINPLWSTRELRGRIEKIEPEADDAVTIVIRPGHRWPGHLPGQYLRVGVVINGVHHWRAYSLTSEPDRPDGCISITPKLVESGVVSPYLVRQARPGELVRLGGIEGTFVLPEPVPEKVLFISAGSGITPIMSMLARLDRDDAITDVVHLHSARQHDGVIFGDRLRKIASRRPGLRLHCQITGEAGRIKPDDLDTLCPDWRERTTFASGPGEMLDALRDHWQENGEPSLLNMERFQPIVGTAGVEGEGGTINFLESDRQVTCEGAKPILEAGEEAGLDLPYGCRMGICHTCVGRLHSGQVRDLRTGEVHGVENEMVRTCVNAPEGAVEIEL